MNDIIYWKKSDLNGSSIEELVCKEVEKLKQEEMSNDDALSFLDLGLSASRIDSDYHLKEVLEMDNDQIKTLTDETDRAIAESMIMAYWRRSKCFDYKITPSMCFFLAQITQDFGEMVIYLTYFQYMCKKYNQWTVDLTFFGRFCFRFGLPSHEDLSKIWSSQKFNCGGLRSDNILDHAIYMKSIRKEQ